MTTLDLAPVSSLARACNTAWVAAQVLLERRVPFLPAETIERIQRRRIGRIIRHAWETVPFYRDAMKRLGLRPSDFQTAADLQKLPLIDLSDVARDPEQFCSSLYPNDRRFCLKTSGSSAGFPLRVYWDHRSLLAKVAHAERDRVVVAAMAGKSWGQRQFHVIGYTAGLVRRFVESRMFASQRAVTRFEVPPGLPIGEMIDRINQVRPQVVFSYGSFADVFFRAILDQREAVCLPRVWVYGGDMLSPDVRQFMEQSGCTVYSTYQSTETGRLGFQCERRNGFHLNVDLCAVRLIPPGGSTPLRISRNPTRDDSVNLPGDRADGEREVPPGEVGEVVVSNLHNQAMVLLNYRLGDLGVMRNEPCECGRSLPVLEELRGRVSQLIRLSDGGLISALTLRHLMAEQVASAAQAQIVYTPPGLLTWRIVPAAGRVPSQLCAAFVEATRKILGPGIRVEAEVVPAIPAGQSGKFPDFIRNP